MVLFSVDSVSVSAAVMVGDDVFIELEARAERGVSAACYASERGVTQLCVEFYSPPFLFLFVSLLRVHAEFERGATWTYPRLLCSSLPFFCENTAGP